MQTGSPQWSETAIQDRLWSDSFWPFSRSFFCFLISLLLCFSCIACSCEIRSLFLRSLSLRFLPVRLMYPPLLPFEIHSRLYRNRDNYLSTCPWSVWLTRTSSACLRNHSVRCCVLLFNQLFYFCFFTNTVSQVIQFRSSYFTSSDNLDLFYVRGVQRPCFFQRRFRWSSFLLWKLLCCFHPVSSEQFLRRSVYVRGYPLWSLRKLLQYHLR